MLVALLLAGCHAAGPQPRHVAGGQAGPVAESAVPPTDEATGARTLALLAWMETVRALGPQARARLAGELRVRTEPGRCSAERVRLAALELAAGAEERARRTLATCLAGGGTDAGVRLVAQALAELADARAAAGRAQARLERLEARVRELERQLEALKAIERSIRARGRANGAAGEVEKDGTETRPARR